MHIIEVISADDPTCYYDERFGFVEHRWQGREYEHHAHAVDIAMKLSKVYPELIFRIVRR